MTRVLITGSADGLGRLAAQMLTKEGHQVVLHARNEQRAKDAMAGVPQAEGCVVGDLTSIQETKALAAEINKLGRFDSIIHNAGIGPSASSPNHTSDGYAATFAANSLAPYILTCLINKPARLVYMSSGMHRGARSTMDIDEITWKSKRWNGNQAYCDSKLHDILLANAVAKRWSSEVRSNSVDPGWQPTKMGGFGAPGVLEEGAKTQVWLATSEDKAATVTGKYFNFMRQDKPIAAALDDKLQQSFIEVCEQLSGVTLPS